jgi:macrolide-specific efflux system membrane fusion protein
VKRGALLAELDHRDLDAAVESAMADVRRSTADREYQQALLSRRESLRHQGLLAQEEIEVQRRDMLRAQAALDQANVALREAHIKQGYARIEAPIDGTVSAIATQEGETVAASFAVPMFVTIVDLNRLHVEAYVNEFDIGKIHTGNTATIANETFRDKPLHGRVSAIIPGAVMRDKTPAYIVYVDLDADSHDARLKPDMTVDVRIATGVVREGIFIPLGLVRHDASSGSYVLMVRKGAQPERRAVSLGAQDGGLIEVTRGLKAGERISEPKAQGENND